MKKGDIAFKVVEKRTRLCTNLLIYRKYVRNREILELTKQYSQLFPRYRKGKVLKADERTEGFFVFEDKFYAEDFICYEHLPDCKLKILRVKLLDTPKRPKRVLNGCGAYPKRILTIFKSRIPQADLSPAYAGCWVCHEIEVLD